MRIYVDLQHQDDKGRVVLICQGTVDDLRRYGIELREGMPLSVYTDAGYREGRREDFHGEGKVSYDRDAQRWVLEVDWNNVHYASDEP